MQIDALRRATEVWRRPDLAQTEPIDTGTDEKVTERGEKSAGIPRVKKKKKYDLDGQFNEFKKVLDDQLDKNDTETHYSLGIAYKEMCLFDEVPRSANVIANAHCTLLRVTKQAFDSMIETHPVLAALFLRAMLRTVIGRLRTMDKRYVDSMMLSRYWPKGSSVTASAPPQKGRHP